MGRRAFLLCCKFISRHGGNSLDDYFDTWICSFPLDDIEFLRVDVEHEATRKKWSISVAVASVQIWHINTEWVLASTFCVRTQPTYHWLTHFNYEEVVKKERELLLANCMFPIVSKSNCPNLKVSVLFGFSVRRSKFLPSVTYGIAFFVATTNLIREPFSVISNYHLMVTYRFGELKPRLATIRRTCTEFTKIFLVTSQSWNALVLFAPSKWSIHHPSCQSLDQTPLSLPLGFHNIEFV